jgi:hypothetical protein
MVLSILRKQLLIKVTLYHTSNLTERYTRVRVTMDYWTECISEALEDAGIVATEEQIETIVSWVEGAHENYGMAHGYDAIPNPMIAEIDKLKADMEQQQQAADAKVLVYKKNVARRYKTSVDNVYLDGESVIVER